MTLSQSLLERYYPLDWTVPVEGRNIDLQNRGFKSKIHRSRVNLLQVHGIKMFSLTVFGVGTLNEMVRK